MEVSTREIMCVCRPCSILFDSEAASEGRYRLVPDRLLNLEDFEMSDAQWENLRVPVDMAFFFYNTPAEKGRGVLSQPHGADGVATGTARPGRSWRRATRCWKTWSGTWRRSWSTGRGGRSDHFLVPIDECYKLVG